MLNRDEAADCDTYRYTRSLLKEKHRELEVLEQRHRREQLQLDEYRSCERSLLQAIGELETLLQTSPEVMSRTQFSIPCRRSSAIRGESC